MTQQLDSSSRGWNRAALAWLIIGIIAVVVIGILAYQVFRPLP